MNFRRTATLFVALSFGSIACIPSAVAAPSDGRMQSRVAADAPDDCSLSDQDSGECLGWAGTAGADPAAATVASAILLGKADQARAFFSRERAAMSSETQNLITQAFAVAEADGADEGARVLAPLVYPSPDEAAGKRTKSFSPTVSPINNGESRAMNYYKWTLHGSTKTQIYYGYKNSSGYHTLGSLTADLEAHTYFQDNGTNWYMDVVHSSGVRPYLTSNVENILQDATGPDPKKSTLNCPGGGYLLNCNVYSNPSMTTGNWYYIQANWTNTPGAYPASRVSVQTRRWKVITSKNWQFPVYAQGG
ncbi:hypothetical protein ABZS29_23070 [Kribbella sp. NPDC005582]|uniref:hypothetical protein n=1 Tax=Kribbella sp. NPDC005582 TaxID=3156893 RepID=UPI00339ED885